MNYALKIFIVSIAAVVALSACGREEEFTAVCHSNSANVPAHAPINGSCN